MIDYFENKVSADELVEVFNSNVNRELFIAGYPYLLNDGNLKFYKRFIDENIHNYKFRLQEDAIDLSINIHYFKVGFLEAIIKILRSRRSYWVKLASLDWLFNFSQLINKEDFLEN